MTEPPESSSIDKEYKTNVDLSYEYIEKSIKEVQDISNNHNTQLGLIIGFNFTFIRFFLNELPDKIFHLDSLPCNSCLLFKILAYVLAITSIILGFFGLYRGLKYDAIKPSSLTENCDKISNVELKLAIIDIWQDKLYKFNKIARQKKDFLNYSIIFLVLSGVMAALDEIIVSLFY